MTIVHSSSQGKSLIPLTLTPDPGQCLAFVSSQRRLPWVQAKPQQARGSEKWFHKSERLILCLSLAQQALHQLASHGIPPAFYPKFRWLCKEKAKAFVRRELCCLPARLCSFVSGLPGCIGAFYATQIAVKWTGTYHIPQLSGLSK